MARKHARILVSIWDDPDFVALTTAQQVTYFALLSSKDLSWCGVNPLLPQRFSGLASDLNERKARAAFDALADARFIVADHDTAEVAARTFVRHDDILNQPNVTKAMGRALGLVRSDRIRRAIVDELHRVHLESPDAKGWPSLRASYPDLYAEVSKPSAKGCRKGSVNPSGNPSDNPSDNPSRKAS